MSEFWAGMAGTLVGAGATLLGQWIKHLWETKERRDRDNGRKSLLRQMLDNPGPTGWRKMETLSRVIGADKDETARLLIEMDARGSEKEKDVWAWIRDKPLP